jgi:hypothetical protein
VRTRADALVDDVARGPEARYCARESLPNLPRASVVIRDVLGFSASESAEILESTRHRSIAPQLEFGLDDPKRARLDSRPVYFRGAHMRLYRTVFTHEPNLDAV